LAVVITSALAMLVFDPHEYRSPSEHSTPGSTTWMRGSNGSSRPWRG